MMAATVAAAHPSVSTQRGTLPTSRFCACFASVPKMFQHFNNCQAVNNGYAQKYLPPVRSLNSSEIVLIPTRANQFQAEGRSAFAAQFERHFNRRLRRWRESS